MRALKARDVGLLLMIDSALIGFSAGLFLYALPSALAYVDLIPGVLGFLGAWVAARSQRSEKRESQDQPEIIEHPKLTRDLRQSGGAYYDPATEEIHVANPQAWLQFVLLHEREHWRICHLPYWSTLFKLRGSLSGALILIPLPALAILLNLGWIPRFAWLLALAYFGFLLLILYLISVYPEEAADKAALKAIGGYAEE